MNQGQQTERAKEKKTARPIFQSRSVEWGTPQALYDALHSEFEFTLDVCAADWNRKHENYFDKISNGLEKNWRGHTCWMNPPYGKEVGTWVKKALKESRNGTTVVALLPVRTDTAWWQDNILLNEDAEVRFLRGRLSFEHPEGSRSYAPFASAVVVFHPPLHTPSTAIHVEAA